LPPVVRAALTETLARALTSMIAAEMMTLISAIMGVTVATVQLEAVRLSVKYEVTKNSSERK
jgi:hypothetical protein